MKSDTGRIPSNSSSINGTSAWGFNFSMTPSQMKDIIGGTTYTEARFYKTLPTVERVIFNPPATIVYWGDGSKTVVKTMKGDKFDEHVGFQAAVTKKVFGSHNCYKDIISDGYRSGETNVKRILRKINERDRAGMKTLTTSLSSFSQTEVDLLKSKIYSHAIVEVEKIPCGGVTVFVDWRPKKNDE